MDRKRRVKDYPRSVRPGDIERPSAQQSWNCEDVFLAVKMEHKKANITMQFPQRVVQRVCVWFCAALGKTPKDTVADLQRVFRQSSYKQSTIYKWHAAFRSGRTKLGDLMRHGAPQRAQTRSKIHQC